MQLVPVQLVPKSQRTWGGQMCYALRSKSLQVENGTHELSTQSRTAF